MLKKIISGGQTGADQAGLDAAIKRNISHGGAIPKGRMTEDGVLPENVIDSDGTVIFIHGKLTGGSLLAYNHSAEEI